MLFYAGNTQSPSIIPTSVFIMGKPNCVLVRLLQHQPTLYKVCFLSEMKNKQYGAPRLKNKCSY